MQPKRVAPVIVAVLMCLQGVANPAVALGPPADGPVWPDPLARLNTFATSGVGAGGNSGAPSDKPQAAYTVAASPVLGTNFANYQKGDGQRAYHDMRAAGAGADRVTFDMQAIEPWAGGWQWDGYNALTNDAANSGIDIFGVLISSAGWAADRSVPDAAFKTPANLDLPWNDSNNRWGEFVFTTVKKYKNRVHAWEIWNEPNLGEFWQGSAEQFSRLTRVSYQAIKAADPTATVVLGGIYRENNLERSRSFWKAIHDLPDAPANHYFMDAVGYHLYDGGSCTRYDELQHAREQWEPLIGSHPLWITETGIRVWDQPHEAYALPDEQAQWLIQNYTYSLSKDAARYFFFRSIDPDRNDIQPWGALRVDGTPRPVYNALRTAATLLPATHEWSVRVWSEDGAVSRITFYDTNLGRVSVLWNITGQARTVDFRSMVQKIQIVHPNGASSTQVSADRHFSLGLEPARNFRWNAPDGACQVAGEPLIIIEADTTPPVSVINPLPSTVPTTTFDLTWVSIDPGSAELASGVWATDVQYKLDNGVWTTLIDWVDSIGVRLSVPEGKTISFRARARDRAGNAQPWSSAATTSTRYAPP